MPTLRAECRQLISSETVACEFVSLPQRNAPAQFVKEVEQECDVVLRLLPVRTLGRHEGRDTFAVRRNIITTRQTDEREPLLGPQPRLRRLKRISCPQIRRHHHLAVHGSEE